MGMDTCVGVVWVCECVCVFHICVQRTRMVWVALALVINYLHRVYLVTDKAKPLD